MTRWLGTSVDSEVDALAGTTYQIWEAQENAASPASTYQQEVVPALSTSPVVGFITASQVHATSQWPTTGYGFSMNIIMSGADLTNQGKLTRCQANGNGRLAVGEVLSSSFAGTGIKTQTGLAWGTINDATLEDVTDRIVLTVLSANSNMMSSATCQVMVNDQYTWLEGVDLIAGPTGLTAAAVSGSQINVSWDAWSGATDYSLERSLDGTSGWTRINGAAPQTGTSFNDTGRSASTPYYYRVKATAGGTDTPYSSVVTEWTFTPLPIAEDFNSGSWPIDSHFYPVQTQGGSYSAGATTVSVSATYGTAMAAMSSRLRIPSYGGVEVLGKMRFTGTGASAQNTRLYIYTQASDTLNASGVPSTSRFVMMMAGSAPLFGYNTGTGENGLSGSGTNMSVGTWYWFRFYSDGDTYRIKYWSDGSSEPSSWDMVRTGSSSGPTSGYVWWSVRQLTAGTGTVELDSIEVNALSPSGFTASAVSTSQINVSWDAYSGATDYSLERSLNGTSGWTRINGTAPQTATSFSDTGRSAATPYYYRVKATAGGTDTPYTSVVSATTLNNLPLIEGFNTGSWPTSFEAAYESAPAVSDAVANASSVTLSGTAAGGTWAITKYASAGTRQSARAKFKMSDTSNSSRFYLMTNSVAADSTTATFTNQVGSSCFAYVTGTGLVGAGFRESSSSGTTYLGPTSSVSMNTTDWFWAHFEAETYDATYMYFRWKVWNANAPEPSTWDGNYLLACPVRSGRPGFGHIISTSLTASVEVDYFHAASSPQSGADLYGSGTLSAVGERVLPVVGYSPAADATGFSNQRKIDRTSNGVLWAFFHPGASSTTMACEPRYSTNDGATWNPGDIAYNGSGSFMENYGRNLSAFIDQDDYAHLVFKDNGNGYVYYRRGTPNAGRTAWTWSSALMIANATTWDYLDVVAHREGTGWKAHVVGSAAQDTVWKAWYSQITVASGGSLSNSGASLASASYGNTTHSYPSIDFNHTGDGKTVAGSAPHLYVAWSAGATGAGKGIRFKKATYSGGTWTWGTEREIDSTRRMDAASWLNCMFDGTRVAIPSLLFDGGSSRDVVVYERDAADTTTTTRLLIDNVASNETLGYGSASYDAAGNLYLVGGNQDEANGSSDLVYRKWDRGTSQLDSEVLVDSTVSWSPYVSAKRGYSGNKIEFVYTDGTASPYTVRYGNISLGASGSVDLSGSGSLGFSGKPAFPGSGSLSGSGTLATAGVPRPIQAVQLSGSGSLTPVRGPIGVARSGVLSGSGTLTRSWVATPIQTVQLSGSGSLVLIGNQREFGTGATSGSGTLTVTRGPFSLIQTRALSGSGTLSFTRGPIAVLSKTATLSGSGALTLAPVVGFARSGVLSGSGALSLAGRAGFSRSGVLSGSGALVITKWFLFQANAYGGTATGTGWVNPGNAVGVDNSAYATWTTATGDAVSEPLIVSNFGTWSGIPAGSTIPKITVRVKGYVDHE